MYSTHIIMSSSSGARVVSAQPNELLHNLHIPTCINDALLNVICHVPGTLYAHLFRVNNAQMIIPYFIFYYCLCRAHINFARAHSHSTAQPGWLAMPKTFNYHNKTRAHIIIIHNITRKHNITQHIHTHRPTTNY